MISEGTRGQGFKGSSEMLKEERYGLTSQIRRSVVSIPSKQTLESLDPGILGPSSPTKLEKNRKL